MRPHLNICCCSCKQPSERETDRLLSLEQLQASSSSSSQSSSLLSDALCVSVSQMLKMAVVATFDKDKMALVSSASHTVHFSGPSGKQLM